MKWFRNLKIIKKLFLYYTIILIGVLALAFFAIEDVFYLDRFYYEATELTQNRVENIISAQSNLSRANQVLRRVYSPGNSLADVNAYRAEINSLISNTEAALNDLQAVSRAAVDRGIGGIHGLRHVIFADLTASHADMQREITRINTLLGNFRTQTQSIIDNLQSGGVISRYAMDRAQSEISALQSNIVAEFSNGLYALTALTFDYMNAVRAEINAEAVGSVFNKFLIIGGVVTLVTILTIALSRTISKPIKRLNGVIDNISKGNLNVNFDANSFSKDEIGLLAQDSHNLVLTIKGMVEDLTNVYHQFVEVGNLSHSVGEEKYHNSFKEMMGLVNNLTSQFTADVRDVADVVRELGDGNFDVELDESVWAGDWVFMPRAVNMLRGNLKSIGAEVNAKVDAIADRGDLHFKIDEDKYDGGWKEIMTGLNRITSTTIAPIEMIQYVLHEMAEGNFDLVSIDKDLTAKGYDVNAENYKGIFGDMIVSAEETLENVDSYVSEINKALAELADGDLRNRITREYVGSFDSIKTSVNNITNILNKTMAEISVASEHVLSGAREISLASQSLADGSSRQTGYVQELTDTIDAIRDLTKSNAQNAATANGLSEKSTDSAIVGNRAVMQMSEAMQQIKESSTSISGINSMIQEIAFQTNLLALNASVEAARAGEHGKGFGVVADEVRSLAGRSQDAVSETTRLIEDSISRVEAGSAIAQSAAEALAIIVANVSEVSQVVQNVSETSVAQEEAAQTTTRGIAEIANVAQGNSASSEETAAAAEELTAQADALSKLVGFFKL